MTGSGSERMSKLVSELQSLQSLFEQPSSDVTTPNDVLNHLSNLSVDADSDSNSNHSHKPSALSSSESIEISAPALSEKITPISADQFNRSEVSCFSH